MGKDSTISNSSRTRAVARCVLTAGALLFSFIPLHARLIEAPVSDDATATSVEETPAPRPRKGLSKRRILKMIRQGVPEAEILAAIAESGSKASLTLDEALRLQEDGVSRNLLVAIATGSTETPAGAVPGLSGAAPAGAAAIIPGTEETLEEEEGVPLDEIAEEDTTEEPEEVMEEEAPPEEPPLLEELLGERETGKKKPVAPGQLSLYSDPPGARIFVAPAATRPADLLRLARPAGRTPARIRLPQGAHYLLVEKKLDPFDAGMIPALRTEHDGEGRTRTLVRSGDLYYDVHRCCLPGSLSGEVIISRIDEDQQGTLLGDEFDGLPPYLWDGNRFLILAVRDGRIARVIKVYEVRKAADEARSLVASFVASAIDPLALEPQVAGRRSRDDGAPEAWEPPAPADIEAVGRFYGIPREGLAKIGARLAATGKAIWRGDSADGAVTLLTLSLDTLGRTRLEEVRLRKDGPYGMLSTPAPEPKKARKGRKVAPPPQPPALPAVIRASDPDTDLPLLTVENTTKSGALIRLGDGTMMFVGQGETRDVTVSPGSMDLEARFDDKPHEKRAGRAHFTYHARYRLKLT